MKASLSGNGEPYTGKINPGTYYARQSGLDCTAGGGASNVQSILEVPKDSDTATITDNCTGGKSAVSLSELRSSPVSPKYATHNQTIFEQFDRPPAGNEPIPVLYCHFEQPPGFIGVDHVVAQILDPNTRQPVAMVLATMYAVNPGSAQSSNPQPVVAANPSEYPQGVPGMSIVTPTIELRVSSASPNGILHPAYFQGMVAASMTASAGVCVDVLKMSQQSQ